MSSFHTQMTSFTAKTLFVCFDFVFAAIFTLSTTRTTTAAATEFTQVAAMAARCNFLIHSKLTSLQASYTLATLCDWCGGYSVIWGTAVFNPPFYATVGKHYRRSGWWTNGNREHLLQQYNSSATSVPYHAHPTPVGQWWSGVPHVYNTSLLCMLHRSTYFWQSQIVCAVAGWEP